MLLLPGISSRGPPETSRARSSTLESPRAASISMEQRPSLVTFRERVSVVDISPGSQSTPEHSKPWVNVKREDFVAIRLLGSGGFGEVKLVRYDMDGELHAMKAVEKVNIMERRYCGVKEPTKGPWNERDVGIQARKWNCPFLVELQATFQTTSKLYYIYEFCAGGELFDLLQAQPDCRFSEPHARFYLAEITLALAHLHSHDVLHRDVKLENVLLTQDGHAKLADFGSVRAKIPSQGTRSFVESTSPIIFMPPEFRHGETYGKELDCWQLGIACYAMLTGGYPPVRNTPEPPQLVPEASEAATAFCHALLAWDRTTRLGYPTGAGLAKDHAFFGEIDWVSFEARFETAPFTFEVDTTDGSGDFRCRRTLLNGSCGDEEILRLRNFSWAAGPADKCSDTTDDSDAESSKDPSSPDGNTTRRSRDRSGGEAASFDDKAPDSPDGDTTRRARDRSGGEAASFDDEADEAGGGGARLQVPDVVVREAGRTASSDENDTSAA
mmetsp:Transcript_9429/g.26444  ORF Transcript_9429/g.26444 Transcript_9429/m.26444 type:complete len:498 (-) Transcript_9429:105-1598(-)